MKRIIFSLIISAASLSLATAQNAGEYMQKLSKDMKNISQASWDYISATSHGNNSKKVDKKRLDLLQTLNDAKESAANAGDFNGNSDYKNAVVHYLDLSYALFNEDYAKLVDMEEVAEQSYDFMEAYMLAKEKANEKLDKAGEDLKVAEKKFATDNNINLLDPEKDKLSENIRISNLVYDHYNEVYLIFFKSYKQEYFLMEAMNANDVNAIEQNRNALLKNAEEGLSKLKTVVAYGKDPALIVACRTLLEFYKSEVEKDIPVIQDFYIKQENFTKVKTAFESKKENDRTQDDVNQYNDAVKSYNDAANAVNTTNEKLNASRSKNLDNWNKTVESYLDKHVPN